MRSTPRGAVLWLTLLLSSAPCALAQRQFEEWPLKRYLPSSPYPTQAVAVADLDGDADLDLVIGAEPRHRLYLNGGAGTFTDVTAARMPAGGRARGLAAGDVDGDGDLDLVVANENQRNQLLLNDGSGTFLDATAARLPPDSDRTEAVALFDCDGDQDLDIVFGNVAQQNRLLLNDGSGLFRDATEGRMPPESDPTTAIAVGDVDGDLDRDLVVGNWPRVDRLYLNDGAGTFTDVTATQMPSILLETSAITLGDFDADSDLDIVVAYNGRASRFFLNDGTGSFADATTGRLPAAVLRSTSIAVDDIDGDADLDIALGSSRPTEPTSLWLNDGTGTFTDVTATRMPGDADETHALAFGDVDGDSNPDLLVGNLRPENRLYLNDGAGTFQEPPSLRIPVDNDETEAVALGDVDGDGDLDIVFGNYGLRNRLYLNDGTGAFADVTSTQMPRQFHFTLDLVLGDVDGDGDLDLVSATSGVLLPRQNELYLNDGSGRFRNFTGLMPADTDSTTSVALADVDGDGDADLVFGNYGSSLNNNRQNRLYINIGAARFTDATAGRMPAERNDTRDVALADVDGDGDADLVCANASSSGPSGGPQNRLFFNDGAGFFTNVTKAHMPPDADDSLALVVADLDGDSDPDLVIGNCSQQDRLYLNDGAGFFTDVTAGRMPGDSSCTTSIAVADVDGDSDPDLVLGAWPDPPRLYLNDGSGTFTDAAARVPEHGDSTNGVALGDVDGDADADLVVANDSPQNRLYTNLHRQLSAPVFAIVGQPYVLELHAEPGYATVSHTGVVAAASGLAPAPLPLPPLGTFYLAPTPLLLLPPVAIPPAVASGTVRVTVPDDPALVGVSMYLQGLVVPQGSPTNARFTGWVADAIRR